MKRSRAAIASVAETRYVQVAWSGIRIAPCGLPARGFVLGGAGGFGLCGRFFAFAAPSLIGFPRNQPTTAHLHKTRTVALRPHLEIEGLRKSIPSAKLRNTEGGPIILTHLLRSIALHLTCKHNARGGRSTPR
jgi:hypothetical protein